MWTERYAWGVEFFCPTGSHFDKAIISGSLLPEGLPQSSSPDTITKYLLMHSLSSLANFWPFLSPVFEIRARNIYSYITTVTRGFYFQEPFLRAMIYQETMQIQCLGV
jgi:hypothetical protein